MQPFSSAQLRRFLLRIHGFDTPFPSVASALDHLGYVQIDPINVCGRMHDLILRNRIAHYPENGLHDFIHSPERPGFEHYLPGQGILVAFPAGAWPFLRPAMEERRESPDGYGGKLNREEAALARDILAEISSTGALSSDAIRHDSRGITAWGNHARQAKVVLEKLFFHGHVLITGRTHFRRIYDLPERVIPKKTLNRKSPGPESIERWKVLTRLRQRRLTTLSKARHALVEEDVIPVKTEGGPTLFALREDQPVLEESRLMSPPDHQPRLIAPLDPIIYDRKQTAWIWNFPYTWEVYTPESKRQRGYYALPLLSRETLAGHIDPKADRKAGKLNIVSRQVARGHTYMPAVRDLARFLGLR